MLRSLRHGGSAVLTASAGEHIDRSLHTCVGAGRLSSSSRRQQKAAHGVALCSISLQDLALGVQFEPLEPTCVAPTETQTIAQTMMKAVAMTLAIRGGLEKEMPACTRQQFKSWETAYHTRVTTWRAPVTEEQWTGVPGGMGQSRPCATESSGGSEEGGR
jgi:hypothetical protein